MEHCKSLDSLPIRTSLIYVEVMAIFSFFVWYYPIGLYKNAQYADTVHSRGFLTFLTLLTSFLFASSFGHMLIAGLENEGIASSLATLLGILSECIAPMLLHPAPY